MLYRAVNSVNPPRHQTPQNFVLSKPEFQHISTAANPVHVSVALAQRGSPWAFKCLVEWAYEVVRLKEALDAPSRLLSLFAFVTSGDAIDFASSFGSAAVFECEMSAPGTVASTYDYGLYYVRPGTFDATVVEFRDAWDKALALASRYWSGEMSVGPQERLIAGALILAPQPMWVRS